MKHTRVVAFATLISMLVLSCSKNEQAEFSDLSSKKEVEASAPEARVMTSGFGSGINIPMDAIVRWVILDANPGITESQLNNSSANFITDLGYQSLDLFEMFMAIERFFYISIPDDEAEKLKTVGDLIQYVESNAFGDFSNSVTDDMGRTPAQVGAEFKEVAFETGPTSNIAFTKPTSSTARFSWNVIRHVYNQWWVKSYDEAEGYRLGDNTAVVYKITHDRSEFQGERHASFKLQRSNIVIPVFDLGWEESSHSTSIASDYKSGVVTVSGGITNYGLILPNDRYSQSCTIRVY